MVEELAGTEVVVDVVVTVDARTDTVGERVAVVEVDRVLVLVLVTAAR